MVPFGYGTNAVLEISQRLDTEANYDLYLVLNAQGLPRDQYGHWPAALATSLHVLVSTNGQTALDREITKMYFTGSHGEQVAYSLAVFGVGRAADVTCRVRDQSDGSIRASGSLRQQRYFSK